MSRRVRLLVTFSTVVSALRDLLDRGRICGPASFPIGNAATGYVVPARIGTP
jgi:hypothetical protein